MKNEKSKPIFTNVLVVIICFLIGASVICFLLNAVKSDRKHSTPTQNAVAISFSNDDYVSKTLEDIYFSRASEIMDEDIQNIMNDSTISEGVHLYFSDFKEFQDFLSSGKNRRLSTETFIRNAVVIQKYFENVSDEDNLTKASIIPYYFIKVYNAKRSSQKEQKALYKLYIDKFVTGRTSLNVPGANVICLYVYACYEACSCDAELLNLKQDIENFLKDYKNDLAVDSDMKIQSNYLAEALEVIRENPEIGNVFERAWIWFLRKIGVKKELKPFGGV